MIYNLHPSQCICVCVLHLCWMNDWYNTSRNDWLPPRTLMRIHSFTYPFNTSSLFVHYKTIARVRLKKPHTLAHMCVHMYGICVRINNFASIFWLIVFVSVTALRGCVMLLCFCEVAKLFMCMCVLCVCERTCWVCCDLIFLFGFALRWRIARGSVIMLLNYHLPCSSRQHIHTSTDRISDACLL